MAKYTPLSLLAHTTIPEQAGLALGAVPEAPNRWKSPWRIQSPRQTRRRHCLVEVGARWHCRCGNKSAWIEPQLLWTDACLEDLLSQGVWYSPWAAGLTLWNATLARLVALLMFIRGNAIHRLLWRWLVLKRRGRMVEPSSSVPQPGGRGKASRIEAHLVSASVRWKCRCGQDLLPNGLWHSPSTVCLPSRRTALGKLEITLGDGLRESRRSFGSEWTACRELRRDGLGLCCCYCC
mmetsp:Transcript_69154/g.205814  ORF Transcript_69154/g.205814 Transcript_69154/m.205814 type:complete len:236 (-) Transcript_69154:237-944(-)